MGGCSRRLRSVRLTTRVSCPQTSGLWARSGTQSCRCSRRWARLLDMAGPARSGQALPSGRLALRPPHRLCATTTGQRPVGKGLRVKSIKECRLSTLHPPTLILRISNQLPCGFDRPRTAADEFQIFWMQGYFERTIVLRQGSQCPWITERIVSEGRSSDRYVTVLARRPPVAVKLLQWPGGPAPAVLPVPEAPVQDAEVDVKSCLRGF